MLMGRQGEHKLKVTFFLVILENMCIPQNDVTIFHFVIAIHIEMSLQVFGTLSNLRIIVLIITKVITSSVTLF